MILPRQWLAVRGTHDKWKERCLATSPVSHQPCAHVFKGKACNMQISEVGFSLTHSYVILERPVWWKEMHLISLLRSTVWLWIDERNIDYGAMYAVSTNKHQPIPHKVAQSSPSSWMPTLLEYLTIEEESQICHQFLGSQWRPNSQVLWSGLSREEVQKWADEHNMQTLTTVMGPLMNPKDPSCLKGRKSKMQWSKYIKGASVIFAW